MHFSLFLALKYMKPKRSFISAVTLLSVLGVLIGVSILVIVMSVMEGFDEMWREKILDFNAHLTVTHSSYMIEDEAALIDRIKKVPGITDAAPHVQTLVMMEHDERIAPPFVMGLSGNGDDLLNRVPEKIRYGTFEIDDDSIMLGWDLANQLGVTVDDTVLVYSPKNVMEKDEIHLPEELRVAAIFEFGMWEFDSRFALTSLDRARDLHGLDSGALAIRVMTVDPMTAYKTAEALREELGPQYRVRTWMDLNRVLFDALSVEKNLMRFLLAGISVVAFFCVAVTLIIVTYQKTSEIGLLKALGFSGLKIMAVFVWHGLIQCIVGTVSGIGVAVLVLEYRNTLLDGLAKAFGLEVLPKEIYQLSELPAKTTAADLQVVAIIVLVCCIFATIIPAARAALLNPVDAFRNEG